MSAVPFLDLATQQQIAFSQISLSKLQKYLDDHPNLRRQINSVFNLEQNNCHKRSALTYFASEGRFKHCWILCKNGADPTARDGFGDLPLDAAATSRVKEVLKQAIDGTLSDSPPWKKRLARAATEKLPEPERPPLVLSKKSSSGPIRTYHVDDGKEPERTPTPAPSTSPPLHHLDFVLPTSARKKFKRFDKRHDIEDIRENLKRLQPKWGQLSLSWEMEVEYGNIRGEIRQELDELKKLLEAEKRLLISDDGYFQSMLNVRKNDDFLPFVSMEVSYLQAWINSVHDEVADWNKRVDNLNTRWAERFNLREPQIITDIVEIYPFVVVTQNRVTPILRQLAEETGALDGFYGSKPKSLARAWEKTAFKEADRMYSANIWDWARGLITYGSLRAIERALDVFNDYEAIEIINVHCGFVRREREVSDMADDERGKTWQDVKVHFRLKYQCPQIICELQLCLIHFTNARKNSMSAHGGHKAYSKFRSVNEMERYVRARRKA